jgi:hypothetical protein
VQHLASSKLIKKSKLPTPKVDIRTPKNKIKFVNHYSPLYCNPSWGNLHNETNRSLNLWKLNLRLATMKIVFVMCCTTNLHKRKINEKKTQDIPKKKMLTREEGEKSNEKHIKLPKTTRGLERGRRNANGNGNYDK